MFLNLFSADDRYSFLNRDNVRQPIQIQLFEKQQTFSEFVAAFLKPRLSFECFIKQDDLHS